MGKFSSAYDAFYLTSMTKTDKMYKKESQIKNNNAQLLRSSSTWDFVRLRGLGQKWLLDLLLHLHGSTYFLFFSHISSHVHQVRLYLNKHYR